MVSAETTGRVEALTSHGEPTVLAELVELCDETVELLEGEFTRSVSDIPVGYRRALVVEDDPAVLRTIERALDPLVEVIDVAPSVAEAVAKVQCMAYDVIFLDLILANGTAVDIAAHARMINERERRRPAYTVLFTGAGRTDLLAAAQRIQADEWFLKPFSRETIQDVANKAFAQRAHA